MLSSIFISVQSSRRHHPMIAITVSIVVISISVQTDRLSGHELALAIPGSSQVVSISVLKRPDIPLSYCASVTYRLVASLVLINKNILNSTFLLN